MSAMPFQMNIFSIVLIVKFITEGLGSYTPFVQDPIDASSAEIVHPTRLDTNGNFMSNNLNFLTTRSNLRRKRDLEQNFRKNRRVLYKLPVKGQDLTLNLTENGDLVAENFVVERFDKNRSEKPFSSFTPGSKWSCHFRGHVAGHPDSKVALSTCHGLTGFISTADGDFLLEPVESQGDQADNTTQPHRIYRHEVTMFVNKAAPMLDIAAPKKGKPGDARHATTSKRESLYFGEDLSKDYCGVMDSGRRYRKLISRRRRWESRRARAERSKGNHSRDSTARSRSKRSVSMERIIEMLVVADKTMVDYYGANDHGGVEKYVLTIVNMVSELFKDASIGNSLQVSLVRLILLEDEKDGPEITSHAENTLDNFCKWAKKINPKGDHHPNHHDVAVLLTRKEICSESNTSCETLGLAHVAGMCQTHRSCSLNQDTGLSVAYTVAHELGHNFAMHHDGPKNDCKPSSKYNHLMAPHLTSSKLPMKWSSCSRRYITRFLDRNWGYCLNDKPTPNPEYLSSYALPGSVYDADHQCRLMFGHKSRYCPGVGDMCNRLWCYVGPTCRTRLHAAASGTKCGRRRWCLGGKCVSMRKHPKRVDGGWGTWSKWSLCSRTCGIGVTYSSRHCDNPVPRNGGRFCIGERKRYKTCSVWRCPVNLEDDRGFRAQQCAEFDRASYRNHTLTWLPVESTVYPCELHCYTRMGEDYLADRLKNKVIDGTKCFSGSDDICVDGICRRLGCDNNVGSRALADRCGVCHGDGSACYEVDDVFDRRKGEEYTVASLLPLGARNLEVIELEPVSNFLALRHPTNSTHYYLNGNYMIQWDTKFQLAGTQFTYKRINETRDLISAPGPLTEDLMLMVLFVKENPGVSIKYTMPYDVTFDPSPELDLPVFVWEVEGWSDCTQDCGGGSQYLHIKCHEQHTGVVEDFHCNKTLRPHKEIQRCNESPCPARWSSSAWQTCSVTCGNKRGLQHRSIACVKSVEDGKIRNLDKAECKGQERPSVRRKCHSHIRAPCPIWRSGKWQECPHTCGVALRNRTVQCITFIEEDIINLEDFEDIDIEKIELDESEASRNDGILMHRKRSVEMKPIEFDPKVDGYEVDDTFCDLRTKPKTQKNCPARCPDLDSQAAGTLVTTQNENHSTTISTATYGDPSPSGTLHNSSTSTSHTTVTGDDNLESGGRIVTRLEPPTPNDEHLLDITVISRRHLHKQVQPSTVVPTSRAGSSMPSAPKQTASEPTARYAAEVNATTLSQEKSPNDRVYDVTRSTAIVTTHAIRKSVSEQNNHKTHNHTSAAITVLPNLPGHQSDTTIGPTAITNQDTAGEQHTRSSSSIDDFDVGNKSGYDPPTVYPDILNLPNIRNPVNDFDIADPVTKGDSLGEEFKKRSHAIATSGDRDQDSTAGHGEWITSGWGKCSVTCGVGARFRQVTCSLPDARKCNITDKPAPAVLCNMGPCAKWAYGEWGRCSALCGNGIRTTKIECVDERTDKILRPHHCSGFPRLPSVNVSCHQDQCVGWRTSRWSLCNVRCGAGIQRRRVVCPRLGQCDLSKKPASEKSCLPQICADWKSLSWNKCSVHCGGGIRTREIICVERETGLLTNSTLCQPGLKPKRSERCNQGQCPVTDYDFANCHADRLSAQFCNLLQKLGRCVQPSLAIQCCVTCKTYLSVRQDDKIS